MIGIVLAGGFAKRMWPLTKEQPKQLLPVADKPMLEYVLEKIECVQDLDKVYLSTNTKFEEHFTRYLESYTSSIPIHLAIEETRSEGEKLGSIGALAYLIEKYDINDEVLIVGGDNLFEFELTDLIKYYREKNADVIGLYDLRSIEKARLYGCVELDDNERIINFVEKPEHPQSTLIATACYMLGQESVGRITEYLEAGNSPDAMGNFIRWLHKEVEVYGYVISGRWFDIGSFESYDEVNAYFKKAPNEAKG